MPSTLATKPQRDSMRKKVDAHVSKSMKCIDVSTKEPLSSATQMYHATSLERITMIREGLPGDTLLILSKNMGISKEELISLLDFSRATVNRRTKDNKPLPSTYSERIIGLQKLIGQVEIMVVESGDSTDFNAARWLADWLYRPTPALNGLQPSYFMDTNEGIGMLSSTLAKMQSGAYA